MEILLSVFGHSMLLALIFWLSDFAGANGPVIIAAGPGENGLGGAIEVGVLAESDWLRFKSQFESATLGVDPKQPPSVEEAKHRDATVADAAIPLPKAETTSAEPSSSKEVVTTDRPVTDSRDKPYTRNKAGGPNRSSSALLGTLGSPIPGTLQGGVGLGTGTNLQGGIVGGTEYGRRLQQALIGYYRLTPRSLTNPRYVIVHVRIARNGRVLSVQGGRLRSEAIVKQSPNPVINARVAAALLELDRHPIPFPPRFLPRVTEALAEVYFQY